ncbi:MAG: hypothetical protein SOV80_01020 [Bacilli bacterium]|nr:hypothetical protein [bacterium]MDY2696786.1 hypothetical protein [Bacilli bacterium]
MMQVQKGQVKYKDRSDIVCTYGCMEDGKQYYFLDGEKLGKGRIVASTALVEAIDPLVLASNIGVIDSDGNVIVPFENKAVKPIGEDAMLVEVSKPVTQSVIEAVGMRRDPLAATKLVTTPAAIKEKINAKMGPNGRFLFNDQFSEATVYDLDGNNLLDNKLYSFIGYNNDVLYLAGNTVDTEVVTYSLKGEEVTPEEVVSEDENTPDTESLDVKSLAVPKEEIDAAMDEARENSEEDLLHPVDFKETLVENNDFPEKAVEESTEEVEEETDTNDDFVEKEEKIVIPEAIVPAVETKRVSLFKNKAKEIEEDNDEKVDVDNSHSLFTGMSLSNDDNDMDLGDNIIEDTAEVMSSLISQNKEQKEIIASQDEQIESLMKFKRKAFEENRTLVESGEALRKKVRVLEKENDRLNDTVSRLEAEISALKGQVAGKGDLAKLIADAKNLLGDNNSINDKGLGRAA